MTCASRDGRGKKTSSEESEEVTVKTEQPATCCMICQGEKKVTKLKGEALEKAAKQMNLLCDYNLHQRKGQRQAGYMDKIDCRTE